MEKFSIGARGHDFPQKTPQALFSALAENKFQQLQLAPKKSFGAMEIASIDIDDIQKALLENKMHISVYGCYVEIAMIEEQAREAALQDFLQSMDVAKALDSSCIACETTGVALQPQASREEAFCALCKSMEPILTRAQHLGLMVCIEPVATHTIHTPAMAKRLLQTLRSENLGIVFDPVNLLTPQNITTQIALWEQSMEYFGENIRAVHMKGAMQDSGGNITTASFEDSCLAYARIFSLLKKLNRVLPIIREELQMNRIKSDQAFLKQFF